MTTKAATKATSPIYPAYCFAASPTYNAWVKLTAADVHALRYEPGYEGQNLYFHLNHPIRYVCLVGTIVAIDDPTPKLAILTLDDGSGQTIEVKIARLPPEIASSVDCPSNTAVDNVDVTTGLGAFRVFVDHVHLDIPAVVKIKCTISWFRNMRQLELKRISTVRSTDDEVKAWAELAAFRRDVLSRPWHLQRHKLGELDAEARATAQKDRERQRERLDRETKRRARRRAHEEKVKVYEEKLESRRRKEEVMMNAGALERTNFINWPP
ncbi:hypothetical protein NA57DRAFT_69606 [Rhizodiscina lignyota]|uniref:CST complex subunit Stn1 N-terminal domain-containing protein n=1 Tax=Rhizodiscina lignyota TaxID=1504668 RepID=A0A9P4M0N2_9PEZI|nr:hypothetical protein NA57DRAFT_69606 [Rhizodiscina lignyota]